MCLHIETSFCEAHLFGVHIEISLAGTGQLIVFRQSDGHMERQQ